MKRIILVVIAGVFIMTDALDYAKQNSGEERINLLTPDLTLQQVFNIRLYLEDLFAMNYPLHSQNMKQIFVITSVNLG